MSESAECVQRRALALQKRGAYKAARRVVTKELRDSPDQGHLWLLRAIAYHAERNWRAALHDIEHAMTLIRLPIGGLLVLGDAYSHLGHTELAVTAYESILGFNEAPPQVYAGVYEGLVRCNRRDLAVECCRVAVRVNPEDHAAYFAMAHSMAAMSYGASYIASILEKAVELAPKSDAYRVSLTLQLVRCGRQDEAYACLTQTRPQTLRSVGCRCSARRLLELCAWAGDVSRSRILCRLLTDGRPDEYPDNCEGARD